jgi:hypothetical protein
MSMDPIPRNLIAVHDLLLEMLAATNDTGAGWNYGIALFPRAGRFEAPVFGVVTRGGESTTLTYRMLQSLGEHTVHISGRLSATVRDGMAFGPPRTPPQALLDQPVLHVAFTCWTGATAEESERTMPLDSTVFAGDLRAPIVLLMESRPEGWPM